MTPKVGVFRESLKNDVRRFSERRNAAARTLSLLQHDTPYASEIRRLHGYLSRVEEIIRQELRAEDSRKVSRP